MPAANFEFLRRSPDFAPLADLAGLAEGYTFSDPVAALVRLRTFGETLTGTLFTRFRLPRPIQANFNDLLVAPAFKASVPSFAVTILHALRKEGNAAAHGQRVEPATAVWALRQAFTLASWVYVAHGGGIAAELPTYSDPVPDDPATAALATPAQKRAALARLAEQDRALERALTELAEARARVKEAPAPGIIDDRLYQQEAVKRVVERFAQHKRRALVVQATGTGKTRVAVALCSALSRARWARRVLFLCDRRALLTQADLAFKEFLDDLPRTTIAAGTAHDKDKRVYLATYPAMMKCFTTFDVGFFDLVIADETHRSIFNRYRDLFEYFDACQVGLTATPVGFVARNTFRMFDCEVDDPTFNYTYEEAVANDPPYLVPYEVESVTTEFLRRGIKYSQMSREQREQLEEAEDNPAAVEHEAAEVDRRVFNRDTNRLILRNLMEHGIKDATGSRLGKSIVFARNYAHGSTPSSPATPV